MNFNGSLRYTKADGNLLADHSLCAQLGDFYLAGSQIDFRKDGSRIRYITDLHCRLIRYMIPDKSKKAILVDIVNPKSCKEITLSTDGEYGHYENKIEKIVLNACGGGGKLNISGSLNIVYAEITVTVNGVQYGSVETTSAETPRDITFECPTGTEPQSGEIVIHWSLPNGQATVVWLKSIQIHDYQ